MVRIEKAKSFKHAMDTTNLKTRTNQQVEKSIILLKNTLIMLYPLTYTFSIVQICKLNVSLLYTLVICKFLSTPIWKFLIKSDLCVFKLFPILILESRIRREIEYYLYRILSLEIGVFKMKLKIEPNAYGSVQFLFQINRIKFSSVWFKMLRTDSQTESNCFI